MLYFATGVSYTYPGVNHSTFIHPVEAANEGEAHQKVINYFEAKGLEVDKLQIFEMIK